MNEGQQRQDGRREVTEAGTVAFRCMTCHVLMTMRVRDLLEQIEEAAGKGVLIRCEACDP